MTSYRFVHSADLHLDSQFGVLSAEYPELEEILRKSTFDAYERIVELCITESVDALLVAGDVFDSADNSLSAQLKFNDGLVRLSEHGIKSFVCHGNHDPLDGWQAELDWPPGAHQFGAEPQTFPLRDDDPNSPLVTGISYPTQEVQENLVSRFPKPVIGRTSIGLIHANVGANAGHKNYAPCTVADLVASEYDYWALGHVHTRNVLRSPDDGSPVIVYPGNSQGRHRNEQGARGVYVVDMDGHGTVTNLKFRETDVLRWHTLHQPIDDLRTEQDLIDVLVDEIRSAIDAANAKHLIYRVIVSGNGPLHGSLTHAGFLRDLRDRMNSLFAGQQPFALCEKIVDTSSILFDRGELISGGNFVSDLLTLIDQVRADPEEILQLGEHAKLQDLYGHVRARRYLKESTPDGSKLAELIDEAERLLLINLVEEKD